MSTSSDTSVGMSTPDTPPPSKEELIARLQDLKGKAEALQARAEQQARAQRAQSGPKWGRILALFGGPIVVGVLAGKALGSIGLGIGAGIASFIVIIVLVAKLTPRIPSLTPGTAAWEAKMNAGLLENVIAQRTGERDRETDANKRSKKDRELAFLKEQLDQARATWAAEDPSPGRGYVGFKPYDGD